VLNAQTVHVDAMEIGNYTRILRAGFGRTPFPQTVNSTKTKSPEGLLSCRQLLDGGNGGISVYLALLNSAKAQGAYAYFLNYQTLSPLIIHVATPNCTARMPS
jgi:hypothetical protein